MLTLSDHGELILNKDSEEESEGQEIPPTLH